MQFTALSNRVYGISNEALIDCFISGLNPEIHRDVLIHSPINLVKVVSLAKVYEEKYTQTQTQNNSKPPKSPNTNPQQPNRTLFSPNKNETNHKIGNPPLLQTPPTRPMHPNQKNPNIKQISAAEIQLRRDKGLCYWCDEKFSTAHKCPNKQIMMLLFDDTENSEDSESGVVPPDKGEASVESEHTEHHLSLNALNGSTSVGTLRFQGQIGKISVQVLVDGRSSNNFIQPRIAKFLKLLVQPAPGFKVLVGNGQYLTVEGVITELPVLIQGHKLTVPVYLLPVAGTDLILGTTWLATLGPHVADYADMTIKFIHHGKFVTF